MSDTIESRVDSIGGYLDAIRHHLKVLLWMAALNLALTLAILIKVFAE